MTVHRIYFVCLTIVCLFSGCANTTINSDEAKYYDPNTGISFSYAPDWVFEEKVSTVTGGNVIVGHGPTEYGYFKMMVISFYDDEDEDLELGIKTQWLVEDSKDNVAENKIYFGPIKTSRYAGVTYAANRAQIFLPKEECALDYRMFTTRKGGRTIVICEKAEIGGFDGLEAEGFNIVEKTIDYQE